MIHYRYYAIVNQYHPSVDDPSVVARRWVDEAGVTREEVYSTDLEWVPDAATRRVQDGRVDGEVLPIAEEAARRFEEVQAERVRGYEPVDGKYDYHAIVDQGFPLDSPRKVIRTWLSPQGYEMEQQYIPGSGWKRSLVLYRISTHREDGEPVPIAEGDVERFKEVLAERVRRAGKP